MNRSNQSVSIRIPVNNNKLLEQSLVLINSNDEIKTLWRVLNVNAIERLSITDHGPVHFQIVSNIGLRLTRMLIDHGVELSVVKHFQLSSDHGELIVFLGCLLHDLGMSVNRDGHEEFSLFLTNQLLRELLTFLPIEERTIVISETLHAIISHRRNGHPITVEAGIVRVADALDMSNGRSRIPFDAGKINIHSLSAFAIENVEIVKGKNRPIQLNILMNNSAGIFQIDVLLKEKLANSGIEQYIETKAYIKGKTEKKLINEFIIASK